MRVRPRFIVPPSGGLLKATPGSHTRSNHPFEDGRHSIPPGQRADDQGFRSPPALRVSRHADELPQRNCWAKDGRRQRERASGAFAYIPEAIT
jgi:hypothetical protein